MFVKFVWALALIFSAKRLNDIFGQAPIYTGIGQAGGWRHGAQRSEPSRLTLQEGRVFYLWFGSRVGFVQKAVGGRNFIGRRKYIGLISKFRRLEILTLCRKYQPSVATRFGCIWYHYAECLLTQYLVWLFLCDIQLTVYCNHLLYFFLLILF